MNESFLNRMMEEDKKTLRRRGRISNFLSQLYIRQCEYMAVIKERLPRHCGLATTRILQHHVSCLPFFARINITYKGVPILLIDCSTIFHTAEAVAIDGCSIIKEERIRTLLSHDIPRCIIMAERRNIFMV